MNKFKDAGRGTRVLTAMALILVMVIGVTSAAATDKNKSIEQYKANAMMATGGGSSMVEINIYRWSEDEERAEILDAIKTATNESRPKRSVATALRGQEKAGYMFLAGRQGWPIRYAREVDVEGERQIILATDRPVSFQEVYGQTQLGDFDVTVIVLKLDDSGKGEGIASVGTELIWNDSTGKIEVTNVSSQPVELRNVRPAN